LFLADSADAKAQAGRGSGRIEVTFQTVAHLLMLRHAMKNTIIVVLLAVSVALGFLFFHQHQELSRMREALATAQGDLQKAEETLKENAEAAGKISYAEKKAQALQETLTESSVVAARQSAEVERLKQSMAASKTNAGGFAAMFRDPKAREMIKSQQKMVLGPMIDKMYADLFQQLNLPAEQSAQIKDLLLQKMLSNADAGMSMMDGTADAEKRAEIGKQVKAENEKFDAKIKETLGEDGYKEFQTFEKSMNDRMVVGQFRDQLAASTGPLSPDQEKQLIQAMGDERANFKWTTDPARYQSGNVDDYGQLFNEDRLKKLAEEREVFDRQFLERARPILTPTQFEQYEKFQTMQREMQMNALKLARTMFGGQQ
jgi:hypothetical protein